MKENYIQKEIKKIAQKEQNSSLKNALMKLREVMVFTYFYDKTGDCQEIQGIDNKGQMVHVFVQPNGISIDNESNWIDYSDFNEMMEINKKIKNILLLYVKDMHDKDYGMIATQNGKRSFIFDYIKLSS
jgi:hypothetical protein